MPRPRMPPTPSSSTDLTAKDKPQTSDMESVFSLPPPALQSARSKSVSKANPKLTLVGQSSPPLSPEDKQTGAIHRRKRTLSGSHKMDRQSQSEQVGQTAESALPPPPSRARKIIQMKPKVISTIPAEQSNQLPTKQATSAKEPTAQTTKRKQGQPSTTTAAGRKIARKTAHSIIERRRRSKMNEEFGVLKDMIPACTGVEMHKLAILQAGIEYVRYLEGCIEQLKSQKENTLSETPISHADDAPEQEDDESMDLDRDFRNIREPTSSSIAVSNSDISSPSLETRPPTLHARQLLPSFRKSSAATSATNSTYASPILRPIQSSSLFSMPPIGESTHSHMRPSISETSHCGKYSTSPPPMVAQTPLQTGVSPAFGAFQLSPDLSRTSTWQSVNGHNMLSKPSPNILPLPQAAMSLPHYLPPAGYNFGTPLLFDCDAAGVSEGQAEATATAALLMMTTDRRGSIDLSRTASSKGMSVKDLLSS